MAPGARQRQPTQATTTQPSATPPVHPVYGPQTGLMGNQPLYYEGAPNPPQGYVPPSIPPPATNNADYGNTNSDYLKGQVDRVFASHGRTAREDEYAQWLKYMQTPDVTGDGSKIHGWDPYWESRLNMHATGDYYGNGTTPDAVGQGQMAARQAAGLDGGSGSDLASLVQSLGNSGGGSGGGGGTPPGPGWVKTAQGGWVPPDHPLAQGAQTPALGTSTGQTGSGSSSTQPFMGDEIKSKIMELLNAEGALNTRVIDSRTESLREELERSRGVETSSLDAALADRGLTGSGGDIAARGNLNERLGAQNATRLRDLYSEEAQRADDRMMQALVTGAGMTVSEAQQSIDRFNAETGRFNADTQRTGVEGNLANERARLALDELLGKGGLGLGQAQLAANYALGQGRLGLDTQLGMYGVQNNQQGNLLELLRILQGGNTNQ